MAKIVFQAEPIEDFYDIGEELGRGNFAVVKRCKHKENGGEYAAKCITKKRSKTSKRGMSKEAVEIEAGVLMALEHEAIIKLYDVFETRTNMTLVMELLTGGELFEEIAKQEFIMEKDACFYVKQILSAIKHMHSQNIVHLDLKPENIVLKYPGSKKIKLIDFGLAKILDPDKELREMLGTPEFSAPEVISYEPVGPFTDMWAIGVVTYVLLSGASPFLGDDDQETYHNITSCDYQFDDEYFEKITEHAKDFIRKLLIKKPRERNTIDDCLDHHWIAFEDEENSIIDTQKMRAFVARRRWKQSLKLVATISRLKMLYRNSTPSPPPDVSGDEGPSETPPVTEQGLNEPPFDNFFPAEEESVAVPVSPAAKEIRLGQSSFLEESWEGDGHKYDTTLPIVDVQLKSGTEDETWNCVSHYGGEYSFEAMENTQSPESNTIRSEAGKSWVDRRKRRTIRRIDWETNYFLPLDSPVHTKIVNHQIGKETAV